MLSENWHPWEQAGKIQCEMLSQFWDNATHYSVWPNSRICRLIPYLIFTSKIEMENRRISGLFPFHTQPCNFTTISTSFESCRELLQAEAILNICLFNAKSILAWINVNMVVTTNNNFPHPVQIKKSPLHPLFAEIYINKVITFHLTQ